MDSIDALTLAMLKTKSPEEIRKFFYKQYPKGESRQLYVRYNIREIAKYCGKSCLVALSKDRYSGVRFEIAKFDKLGEYCGDTCYKILEKDLSEDIFTALLSNSQLGEYCDEECRGEIVDKAKRNHKLWIIAERSDINKFCDNKCLIDNMGQMVISLSYNKNLTNICNQDCIVAMAREGNEKVIDRLFSKGLCNSQDCMDAVIENNRIMDYDKRSLIESGKISCDRQCVDKLIDKKDFYLLIPIFKKQKGKTFQCDKDCYLKIIDAYIERYRGYSADNVLNPLLLDQSDLGEVCGKECYEKIIDLGDVSYNHKIVSKPDFPELCDKDCYLKLIEFGYDDNVWSGLIDRVGEKKLFSECPECKDAMWKELIKHLKREYYWYYEGR